MVQEVEWAPGPVWTVAENLTTDGIRSPDRPACSQSLYRPDFHSAKYKFVFEVLSVNRMSPELFFLILARPVYKM
jgi:hypothetical protein